MNELLVPILAAAAVALVVWVGVRLVATLIDPERKRLQSRLSTEANRPGGGTVAGQRTIVHKTEAEGLAAVLTRWSPLKAIHERLLQTWPEMSVTTFILIAAGCAIAGALVGIAGAGGNVIIALGGAGIGGSVPFLVLSNKRSKRQRMLSNQLPEALDFLSRVLKAGHSFSTGVMMMGEELPKPLGTEFRRAYDQHTLGQSIELSLKDMAHRIDSTDFAFFVTAVLIQRQTGGDLSEVLKNISGMIRQRVRLQQHVKAKTAEGRFTGYILVAFPLVMFMILACMNPKYAKVLTGTDTGHKLLATAFILQMLGLWAIRKITTIRV